MSHELVPGSILSLLGLEPKQHFTQPPARYTEASLIKALEEKGIYVSAGSACASNKPQTSATLKAMKLPKELWDSTIRFSFSVYTTREEIDYTLDIMYDMIPMLRKYTRR